MNEKICFIGAGNMASALINGILSSGYEASQINISDPSRTIRDNWRARGVSSATNNQEAIRNSDILVLAVKPQIFPAISKELFGKINKNQKIVSIIAGVNALSIQKNFGLSDKHLIFRAMPNTPALVSAGITAIHCRTKADDISKTFITNLFSGCGKTIWVDDEEHIDSVTAISGSGPAYFFLVYESMIAAGMKLGLSEKIATELTVSTAMGASILAQTQNKTILQLRSDVTSPKGTTNAAIKSLLADDFPSILIKGILSAHRRAKELSIQNMT